MLERTEASTGSNIFSFLDKALRKRSIPWSNCLLLTVLQLCRANHWVLLHIFVKRFQQCACFVVHVVWHTWQQAKRQTCFMSKLMNCLLTFATTWIFWTFGYYWTFSSSVQCWDTQDLKARQCSMVGNWYLSWSSNWAMGTTVCSVQIRIWISASR